MIKHWTDPRFPHLFLMSGWLMIFRYGTLG